MTFIDGQTVEVVLTICSELNLNHELSITVLDTYTKYAKILSSDISGRAMAKYHQNTTQYMSSNNLWREFTNVKYEMENFIEHNALLSILLIISLCTKSVEGPRNGQYLNMSQLTELLKRNNIEMSPDQLKSYEFGVFEYIDFQVRDHYHIRQNIIQIDRFEYKAIHCEHR